jgi:hypothetical protein
MRVATPNPVFMSDVTVLLAVLGRMEGELRGGLKMTTRCGLLGRGVASPAF